MANDSLLKSIKGKYISGRVTLDTAGIIAGNYEVIVTFLSPITESGDFQSGNFSQLSNMEMMVLNLIGAGATNKDIAEQLELKDGTVRNYVSSLLDKFKVNSRSQLVNIYHRLKNG